MIMSNIIAQSQDIAHKCSEEENCKLDASSIDNLENRSYLLLNKDTRPIFGYNAIIATRMQFKDDEDK